MCEICFWQKLIPINNNTIIMKNEKNYVKPELEMLQVFNEGSVLTQSTFGNGSGEGISFGDQVNPWN